jgi:hypothetical protein
VRTRTVAFTIIGLGTVIEYRYDPGDGSKTLNVVAVVQSPHPRENVQTEVTRHFTRLGYSLEAGSFEGHGERIDVWYERSAVSQPTRFEVAVWW